MRYCLETRLHLGSPKTTCVPGPGKYPNISDKRYLQSKRSPVLCWSHFSGGTCRYQKRGKMLLCQEPSCCSTFWKNPKAACAYLWVILLYFHSVIRELPFCFPRMLCVCAYVSFCSLKIQGVLSHNCNPPFGVCSIGAPNLPCAEVPEGWLRHCTLRCAGGRSESALLSASGAHMGCNNTFPRTSRTGHTE